MLARSSAAGVPGASGIGNQREPTPLLLEDQRVGRQAAAQARIVAGPDERRDQRRLRPAGVGGRRGDGVAILVGVEQQPREAAPSSLRLAGRLELLARVALRRERRDSSMYANTAAASATSDARVGTGADRRLGEAPPRDPRAETVGGEQRVERAPLAVLAAAEPAIDPRRGGAVEPWILDQVDELSQRLLDPDPDPAPKRPRSGRLYAGTPA